MKIKTLPVYSKLADENEVQSLGLWDKLPIKPDGSRWQLSQHQVETYRALTEGDADVIFNTAMTGDGKSLAAYLPVLIQSKQVFGMYPTNELLKDQNRQIQSYLRDFRIPLGDVKTRELDSRELSKFKTQYEYRMRGDALHNIFVNHPIILTNPDIFNLVMTDSYRSLMYNRQELPFSLNTNFDYFVFDEFHIFQMPQVVAVISAMVYLLNLTKKTPRFIFSSATPVEILQQMAERGGLRHKIIKGEYRSELALGYRPMLYSAVLNIHKLEPGTNAETWVLEYLDDIVAFWNACERNAKGAIIVNSVATARRLLFLLKEKLEKPHQITIGEITGLTDKRRRNEERQKDIVIGTSTIDVGVDFNINFLIFESTNGGTFLQRLGRLGRAKLNLAPFPKYEAHALLSGKTPWIYERLVKNLEESGVHNGSEVERSVTLRDAVNGAFPQENEFTQYARRWGMVQPAHVVNVLKARENEGAYESMIQAMENQYGAIFDVPFSKAMSRYWTILHDKQREKKVLKVLDEILAFRGTSPFQIVCMDASNFSLPPSFLTYDLLSLLTSADYEPMERDEFEDAVREYAPTDEQDGILASVKYTLGGESETPIILKLNRFNREREQLLLHVDREAKQYKDQVCVVRGFSVSEPASGGISQINSTLRRQSFVAYITSIPIKELRTSKFHLPAFFSLYRLKDMHGNREYTVTFGKSALMLESILLRYRSKHPDDEDYIIC